MKPFRPDWSAVQRYWVASLMLGAVACDGSVPGPAGRAEVNNPTPDAATTPAPFRLVEELVIRPAEGSPGELAIVRSVVADDDRNVYVLQQAPSVIKVFDRSGAWVRNIGGEGDGPGEFRRPHLGIRGDTIVVHDPSQQRLTVFARDGALLATHGAPCCVSLGTTIRTLSNGLLLLPGLAGGRGAVQGSYLLYATELSGAVRDTLRPPASPLSSSGTWEVRVTAGGSVRVRTIGIPNHPRPSVAWRSDGSAVVGVTDRYAFAILSPEGDTLWTFTAAVEARDVTAAERDSMLGALIDEQVSPWRDGLQAVAKVADIPSREVVWSAMAVDNEDRIWVARPGSDGPVSMLDVFDADGALLGSTPAPVRAILTGYWRAGRVYVNDTDGDYPVVRIFRLQTR